MEKYRINVYSALLYDDDDDEETKTMLTIQYASNKMSLQFE